MAESSQFSCLARDMYLEYRKNSKNLRVKESFNGQVIQADTPLKCIYKLHLFELYT